MAKLNKLRMSLNYDILTIDLNIFETFEKIIENVIPVPTSRDKLQRKSQSYCKY